MSEPDHNDIVHRLRNPSHWLFRIVGPKSGATVQGESDAPREAADEIERLRAELAAERERANTLENRNICLRHELREAYETVRSWGDVSTQEDVVVWEDKRFATLARIDAALGGGDE